MLERIRLKEGQITIGERTVDFESILNNDMEEYFESRPGKGKDVEVQASPSGVKISVIGDESFGCSAKILGFPWKKMVRFTIHLVDDETGLRHLTFLSGQQFVESAMNFLQRHHDIKGLITEWREYSDNYKSFYANKAAGRSPRESALLTWSGINIASKYGFDKKVEINEGIYKKAQLAGQRYVNVRFTRN